MKYFIYIFYNGSWHTHSGWTNLNIAKMKLHELQQLNPNVLMTIDLFDPKEKGMHSHDRLNINKLKSHETPKKDEVEFWQDMALTFKEENERLKIELKASEDNTKIIEANADFWHHEYMELKKRIKDVINHLKTEV